MKAKAFVAILLVILYGIALLKPAFPLLDYYIQMEVYLEQCGNKNRPELHCNGQCVLMQKLKAIDTDSGTPAPPAPAKVDLREYPVCLVLEGEDADPGLSAAAGAIVLPITGVTRAFHPEIFHPPATV